MPVVFKNIPKQSNSSSSLDDGVEDNQALTLTEMEEQCIIPTTTRQVYTPRNFKAFN
jgi:hypothetical protein